MLKVPAMLHYTFYSAIVACLFLPTVGLTAEDTTVAGLRARVEVLDQARDKAAVELSAKEQQGIAADRDREHFRTVAEFLDQQIAQSCGQLVEKGDTAAAADLPCPNPVVLKETGQNITEEKSPAEEKDAQASPKLQEKVVEPVKKKEASPVTVQSAVPPSMETVPVNREKMEAPQALPQQPPATGFFAAIRRWFESLFAPKPPPATSGSKSGQSAEQAEKTTAEQENSQRSSDSTAQQAEQKSAEGNKGAAATTGNKEQAETSAGAEKVASGEKGSGQVEEQQQRENGIKQAAADAEKSGHQAGNEKAAENGAKGADAAGGKDSKSGETSVAAGSGTTKQQGMQGESREAAIGKAGTGQAAGQKGDSNDGQEARQGTSSSRAGDKKTADIGSNGKGQPTGQETGTGQQGPAEPTAQPMVEIGKEQPGPVGSGPGGEKKTGQSQKKGSGSPPGAETEVAKLEKSLSDALGEFDGKLLSEQERLAARIPKQREGSTGGSGGGYGAEGPLGPDGGGWIAGDGYEGSERQQGDGRAGAGGQGQRGSVATGGGKSAPAGERTTIDTDDDIVARQLREAAENETDPELKEKLWQEYRKYKQGGG